MKKIDFGKQIGPLPLGAWIIVIAVGLAIAYSARKGGGGEPESVDPLEGYLPDSPDSVGAGPGWVAVPPPTTAPGATEGEPWDELPEVGGVPVDNDEWGRIAISYLIAQGYDPALAQSAIAKALQGLKMGVREYMLWGIALRRFGAPPYPVDVVPPSSAPGPVTTPTAPPRPSTAPAKNRYGKVPAPMVRRIDRLEDKGLDRSQIVARLTKTKDNAGGARQLSKKVLKEIGFSNKFINRVKAPPKKKARPRRRR